MTQDLSANRIALVQVVGFKNLCGFAWSKYYGISKILRTHDFSNTTNNYCISSGYETCNRTSGN